MKKKFFSDLGKRIQEMRKSLGIKQNELANEIGMHSSYLSELEKGNKSNPGVVQLFKIAKKYGVNLNYLVMGEGEMFLAGKEVEDRNIEDFNPSFSDLEELVWLMKNSVYFKNMMMTQAARSYIENEDFIKKELKRNREKRGKPIPENEE